VQRLEKLYITKMKINTLLWLLTLGLLLSSLKRQPRAMAQGIFTCTQRGYWVNAKWLNLDQNLIPAGNALIPGAEIHVDVFSYHPVPHLFYRESYCSGLRYDESRHRHCKAMTGPPIGRFQ